MTETPHGQELPDQDRHAIDRRAWSTRLQVQVILALAAAALVIVASLWAIAHFSGHGKAVDNAPAPPGTFRASPQQLKTLTIEAVAMHGFVSEELTEGKIVANADRLTAVFSPYSGRITRLAVGPGDVVRAGAPLAWIAASEFAQARSDLSVAAAQARLARSTEARKHALVEARGGSLQDWQQAQADLATAEAQLLAVRNRLRILGKSDAEIDGLEASAGGAPDVALPAPIAGVVVDRQAGPGQFVQAGAGNPLFTIADTTSVWMLANVRETDAGAIRRGQPVEVRVPAWPDRIFRAQLTYVSAIVDAVTHRVPVRAEIDNRDGALKPEMFASFRIVTSGEKQAPAVPESALVYEGAAAHVWVVRDDNLIAFRAVHTGRNNGGLVEILDGLQARERIVIRGGVFIDQVASPATP